MSDFETEFARRNMLLHALTMAPCLHDPCMRIRQTAEASLIRRLPSLCPQDREWVDRQEVRSLVNAINVKQPELTIAILNALEHIGDGSSYLQVEWLIGATADCTDANARRIHAAAYSCLQRLREQAARERQAHTLLRGSESPDGDPRSTLLRPVHETASAAPAELLRPGAGPIGK